MSDQPDETKPEPLDPDIFKRLLENQSVELLTRQQDQEIKKRQIEITHEYALKNLEAQLVDRQREREHTRSTLSTGVRVIIVIILIIAGGICYALYLNKDQIVIEVVKAIVYVLTGMLGGYSVKGIRSRKDEPKE
jgi:hypothetical protein